MRLPPDAFAGSGSSSSGAGAATASFLASSATYLSDASRSATQTAFFSPSSAPSQTASASLAFGVYEFLAATKGKFQTGDWSSLIGIVTAICGNVLISVALNTQRYAHIKLAEQGRERKRLLRRAKLRQAGVGQGQGQGHRRNQSSGYGTDGRKSYERQAAATNGIRGYRDDEEDEEAGEDQPLLSVSMHSEATATSTDTDTGGGDGEEGSEDAINEKDEEENKSYLKSPYWWAGIVMMTIGEAGNFLAYGFAPASIVSPLGVVALISNCIIAPFFLKERFRKRDFLGVLIAVGGAVTVVLSANDSNPKLGPKEIWRLIGTWEFETYLGITIAVICGLMWASSRYGDKSIFIDLGLVGLFGGYTALSTKGVASMLSYTLFKALTFPITYLLVAILVFTAIMQIKYVNRALKRFDSTQVIPTQFVMFTLSVILGSAVLYRDFEKESGEAAGKFIGGCAMTFLGVYLITSARQKGDDEDEVLEEDEEAIRLATEGVYHDDPEAHGGMRPEARRSSTAPLSGALPINGQRAMSRQQLSPPESPSLRDSRPGHFRRTSTTQSTSLLEAEPLESTSLVEPSPLSETPWIPPEQQSSKAKRSIQKLLQPLENILPQQTTERNLPSTLKSTTSEPILPTEAQYHPERPQTPPNPRSNTTFPQHLSNEYLAEPHTPDAAKRLSRPSISDLIPGPLTATLSSPLSAIVADSLRRGVDVSSLKPRRKRKMPKMPRGPGGSMPAHGRASLDSATLDSDLTSQADPSSTSLLADENAAPANADNDDGPRRSRLRSLSGTLGDLFTRSTKRIKRTNTGEEQEGDSERRVQDQEWGAAHAAHQGSERDS